MATALYMDRVLADIARAHVLCTVPISTITEADREWLDSEAGQTALRQLDLIYAGRG